MGTSCWTSQTKTAPGRVLINKGLIWCNLELLFCTLMGRISSNASNENEREFISGGKWTGLFLSGKTIADDRTGLKWLLGGDESRSHQNAAQMRRSSCLMVDFTTCYRLARFLSYLVSYKNISSNKGIWQIHACIIDRDVTDASADPCLDCVFSLQKVAKWLLKFNNI